jgi:hypothetical protein
VKIGSPQKSKLLVASKKDPTLTLGRGAGSGDDPIVAGGLLVVASAPDRGDFSTTYPLDAATGTWKAKRKKGVVVGYAFKGTGPIRSVAILAGKTVVVKGKGEGLGHDLGDNPNPVTVVLLIGQHAYCLEFGGGTDFRQNARYRALNAPPPNGCGSQLSVAP